MKLVGHRADCDRTSMLQEAEGFPSRGRVRKAIREYEKVLAVDPQNIEVHTKIPQLCTRVGRKDQAKASLKWLIEWNESEGFLDKTIAMLRVTQKFDCRARRHVRPT